MNNGESTPGVASPGRLDPVCGMEVAEDTAFRTTREGILYLFCGEGCREKFLAAPEKFLAVSPAEHPPGKGCNDESCAVGSDPHDDGIYTCPMHPKIQQQGPGNCPKCGMALGPRAVMAEEEKNEELIDMTRRFRIGATLAIPVFLLAMVAAGILYPFFSLLLSLVIAVAAMSFSSVSVIVNALRLRKVKI